MQAGYELTRRVTPQGYMQGLQLLLVANVVHDLIRRHAPLGQHEG